MSVFLQRKDGSKRLAGGLLWLALLGLAGATVIVLGARLWTPFDLLTHFRVQYVILAAVILAAALLQRRPAAAVLAIVCAMPHALALESLFDVIPIAAEARAGISQPAATLRLTTMNISWDNRLEKPALDYVKATRPDVLVLQEASGATHPLVRSLNALYPYEVLAGREADGSAPLLFSRYPILSHASVIRMGDSSRGIQVELDVSGTRVTVIGLHLSAPVSRREIRRRNRQLIRVGKIADRVAGPLIVAGDLNSSPWSPYFGDFLASAPQLTDAVRGRGWLPTWPVQAPPLGVPIDHILVNARVAVTDVTRGPDIGSDHFPLSAELAVLPQAASAQAAPRSANAGRQP